MSSNDERPTKYSQLIAVFHEFLIVATHKIIYIYKVYPESAFERAKYHGLTVHQSRHPAVKKWIEQMSVAVMEGVRKNDITTISIIIIKESDRTPVERVVFDMSCFGIASASSGSSNDKDNIDFFLDDQDVAQMIPNWDRIFEEYQAYITTLSNTAIHVAPEMYPLSFTVAIELKNKDQGPMKTSAWMAGESKMKNDGLDLSVPIRYVDLGVLSMNSWIQTKKNSSDAIN